MLLSLRRRVTVSSVLIFVCLCFASIFHLFTNKRVLTIASFCQSNKIIAGLISQDVSKGCSAGWTTENSQISFAYAQYATDVDYFCNAVINFERLQRFETQADKVLIYPEKWDHAKNSRYHKAIQKVRSKHPYIQMQPSQLLSTNKGDSTWSNSLTKFHAFNLTSYSRVLLFDSDSLVLNNMDHYFLAPAAPIAVPRAYWLASDPGRKTEIAETISIRDQILTSHVMLIEPNASTYQQIVDEMIRSGDFDMEIVNTLFRRSAMILPHRRLALLTGEFRTHDHSKYMAEDPHEEWNAHAELSRAYLVYFSDWPLPKPWKYHSAQQWKDIMPSCGSDPEDEEREDRPKCANQLSWLSLYEDYDWERKDKCDNLLI